VRLLLAGLVLAGLAVAVPAADPPEQAVTPLAPASEQRVDAVVAGGPQQDVEKLDAQGLQDIAGTSHTSPAKRAATTVGKVALGVVALGVSLGFTVASLLFF
jgi:hypothetical protein